MEFISVEEFINQPEGVQKVFRNWWQPSIGDLATDKHGRLNVINCDRDIEAVKKYKGLSSIIPLFTEGQLRKFIEDKTNGKVMVEYTVCENIVLKLATKSKVTGGLEFKRKCSFPKNKFSLLQAYWKVALKVAEESVENEYK